MNPEAKAAIIASVVGALFYVFGTLGGTWLTSSLSTKQRTEERALEDRKALQQERRKLLERMSITVNSKPRAARLNRIVLEDAVLRDVAEQCLSKAKANAFKASACRKSYDPLTSSAAHKEWVELHAAYVSTLQLSKLYFGKEVIAQVEFLTVSDKHRGVDWWEIPTPDFLVLLKAMHAEIAAAGV
jgi:hypothetical protein